MEDKFRLKPSDKVWVNSKLATMDSDVDNHYGMLENHALVTNGGVIVSVVETEHIDKNHKNIIDLGGALVTPGFIDCHTHLVFGGNRAMEWEMRLNGISYVEISSKGGGINSTVKETRNATFDTLYKNSYKRLLSLAKEGVTTIEAKSGYGLDFENEKKQLEVVRKLGNKFPVDISPTLLSAHSVPPEFKGDADKYLDEIITNIMPKLWSEKLFESVDVFCENIAFNLEQTRRLFDAAKKLGIPVKAHAEQLTNIGGSALVAQYGGLSVDHIEYLDEKSIEAISKTRTVASLLPMAFYFLKEKTVPPVELLRKYKVPMAVSTDFNPGTSPFATIRMAMNMACTFFALTPAEVMAGVTRNAAKALNREKTHGQLKKGYQANFCVWDVAAPVEIFYELGHNPLIKRVFKGEETVL